MEFFTQLTLLQALFWAAGVVVSLLLLYQDLKGRTVHVLLLVGLAGAGIGFHYRESIPDLLLEIAPNLVFISTILLVAGLYFRLRHGSFAAFPKQIGLGDILYFLAATPWFTPFQFILFFVTGILLVLAITMTLHLVRKIPKDWPIPLAGLLAGWWILFLPIAGTLDARILPG